MQFLFFISLLAVAAASTSSLPLSKLLLNPKLFASAFAHSDSNAINKMITLIDQLIKDGEAAKSFAIDDHESKTATHNAAVTTLGKAKDSLATADAALDVARSDAAALKVSEAADKQSLKAAEKSLRDATAHEEKTSAHLASTTDRVDLETASFNKIIELLESTVVQGRRLLSIDQADPKAVKIVVAKVKSLLADAASELIASQSTQNSAASAKKNAETNEKDARDKHTATAGKFAAAKTKVSELDSVAKTKLAEKNDATEEEQRASLALTNALAFKQSELARIGREDSTLKEAKQLLEDIPTS